MMGCCDAKEAKSGGEIKPSSVDAVLDLNNPKIGIERDLSFKPLLRVARVDALPGMRAGEDSVDATRRIRRDGLGRRPIERRAPIQVIDFDKNSSGLRSAAPAKDRTHTFQSASAQIGCDPNVGTQAHRV
jgi:hypothetical protein